MNRIVDVQESRRFGLDAECKLRHATQQQVMKEPEPVTKNTFANFFNKR